jgi:hypothetical protein
MAFYPNADQLYYLIPKHSQDEDMCVGVEDYNLGRPLQLQKINSSPKKAAAQQFSFEANGATYWIKLSAYDLYLNVAQASTANVAHIVTFQKEDKNHEQFQLLYAGGGYYRIGCYHSQKVFDVWGAKKEAGSPVLQYELSGTDNQLFKLVAAASEPIKKNTKSFIEANETTRDLSLAVIAKIPDYGAGLAFVVGTFWQKEDKLAALWSQMKSYVDARLEEYFKKAKLDNLASILQGTMDELAQISQTDINRGARLVTAIDGMVKDRASFHDKMEATLPYFVALQTIIIGARHTLYHDFDFLFPGNPKGKEESKQNLINDINKYTKDIEDKRIEVLESRVDKINATLMMKQEGTVEGSKPSFSVFDHYDGWKKDVGEDDLTFTVDQRKNQVKIQFGAQLDELLYTSRFWKYLLPDAPFYSPELKQLSIGTYGRNSEINKFGRGQGRITEINLSYYNTYANPNAILGTIEVFYDGVSQGKQGGGANYDHSTTQSIKLAEGEWICSVYGSNDLQQLMITTTKGQIIKTGNFFVPRIKLDRSFCADLPDSLNAKLVGIAGSSVQGGIGQLTFYWDYIR